MAGALVRIVQSRISPPPLAWIIASSLYRLGKKWRGRRGIEGFEVSWENSPEDFLLFSPPPSPMTNKAEEGKRNRGKFQIFFFRLPEATESEFCVIWCVCCVYYNKLVWFGSVRRVGVSFTREALNSPSSISYQSCLSRTNFIVFWWHFPEYKVSKKATQKRSEVTPGKGRG